MRVHLVPGLIEVAARNTSRGAKDFAIFEMGSIFRSEIKILQNDIQDNVLCVENFGKVNYFSAMKYANLLIGNTSSGILEAASFGKYVVNVGNRQEGRLQSENVLNAYFKKLNVGALNKFLPDFVFTLDSSLASILLESLLNYNAFTKQLIFVILSIVIFLFIQFFFGFFFT